MHCKVCSNPPEGGKHIRTPKKSMTLKEAQLSEVERMRKVHEHH